MPVKLHTLVKESGIPIAFVTRKALFRAAKARLKERRELEQPPETLARKIDRQQRTLGTTITEAEGDEDPGDSSRDPVRMYSGSYRDAQPLRRKDNATSQDDRTNEARDVSD